MVCTQVYLGHPDTQDKKLSLDLSVSIPIILKLKAIVIGTWEPCGRHNVTVAGLLATFCMLISGLKACREDPKL